jgi:hypothetical protein
LIALICNAHHARFPAHFPRQRRSAIRHALYVWRGSAKRNCAHYFRKTRSIHASRTPKCAACINRPEVNQTKPEQAAEGGKICADSAGYAPQALVPLYDVN